MISLLKKVFAEILKLVFFTSLRRQILKPVFPSQHYDEPVLEPSIDDVLIPLGPEALRALAHIRRTISHFPRPAPDSSGVLIELQLEASIATLAKWWVNRPPAGVWQAVFSV